MGAIDGAFQGMSRQASAGDLRTPEDDLAISEAIYEVERELKRDEHSSFDPMVVDIDAIDQDLRQVPPESSSESTAADGKSAEDDIAIAEAINEVERELKQRNTEGLNPTMW
eukprot:CAMPEP_0173194716 /NCGR_PEP_ID=MMETSP1141-20130122/14659_1 /TAXON_ID=483371 /ORGANISM="non described non described, Strain CCMP2298" /LENGTH=111 /DNA_ID=CAMNT_0014119175 /DNA_START=52 /DNA_END=384 /DNA_ORIENTATION=+